MGTQGSAILLAGQGQPLDAGLSQVQGFVALGRRSQGHQTSGQQINLKGIATGPTGRAPDLHQARSVQTAKGDGGGIQKHP